MNLVLQEARAIANLVRISTASSRKPKQDSSHPESPFPLLKLPVEIRNMVYEHVLFASASTEDVLERLITLGSGIQIHTNILLASRQLFEEARNVLIGAQLVLIDVRGWKPTSLGFAAVIKDGIPLFHPRYRAFCLLQHTIEEYNIPLEWYGGPHDECCLVLRREDVFRFCGGIPGLDPDCYVPQMLSRIRHHLYLCSPEISRPRVLANVPTRVPTHRRLLEEYQRALAGCCDVWVFRPWSLEMNEDDSVSGSEKAMFELMRKISSSNPARFCSGSETD